MLYSATYNVNPNIELCKKEDIHKFQRKLDEALLIALELMKSVFEKNESNISPNQIFYIKKGL